MNGYAIYKVQTRSSIKDKQVKEIIPSPVSSLIGQKCSQKTKKSCYYIKKPQFSILENRGFSDSCISSCKNGLVELFLTMDFIDFANILICFVPNFLEHIRD